MSGQNTVKPQERFLKIPYSILNMRQIGLAEKAVLAHIHSFGLKGCWQSNETLGEMFFVTPRTITAWIANLKRAGCILWLHPKGRYRTIWAKGHSDVKAATMLPYMGRQIQKAAVVGGQGGSVLLGRNLPSRMEEGFQVTTKNRAVEVGKNLLPTNNTTTRDTKGATATPSPLPAGGQAPALLADRLQGQRESVRQFSRSFGNAKVRRDGLKLTPDEFEQRRQAGLAALGCGGKLKSGKKLLTGVGFTA